MRDWRLRAQMCTRRARLTLWLEQRTWGTSGQQAVGLGGLLFGQEQSREVTAAAGRMGGLGSRTLPVSGTGRDRKSVV